MSNLLSPWTVTFQQPDTADFRLAFDCSAEDEAHALEQCLNAYPDCTDMVAAFVDPFKDSFMQPVIEHSSYFEVETTAGTEIVPAELAPAGPVKCSDLRDYLEGDVLLDDTTEPRSGWIARMSAPGYTDCTSWSSHETAQEAYDHLIEMCGDDS